MNACPLSSTLKDRTPEQKKETKMFYLRSKCIRQILRLQSEGERENDVCTNHSGCPRLLDRQRLRDSGPLFAVELHMLLLTNVETFRYYIFCH